MGKTGCLTLTMIIAAMVAGVYYVWGSLGWQWGLGAIFFLAFMFMAWCYVTAPIEEKEDEP